VSDNQKALIVAMYAGFLAWMTTPNSVFSENLILQDKNPLVCRSVRGKLTGFGLTPLGREINLLLFEASQKSCGALVKELVTMNAAVDARDRSASTPLMKAAEAGHVDIVKYLESVGGNINHRSLRGNTALLLAVRSNRTKVVKYLLQQGADPNILSLDNITPLSAACFDGNTRLIKYLLDAGADPKTQDGTGKSPIIYAAAKGFSGVVKTLLSEGVDPNEKYKSGLTAVMWAAGHTADTPAVEGVKTIMILGENKANLNTQDDRGMTALMYAYQLDNMDAAAALLSLGANPDVRDASGKVAADYAN